MHTDVYSLSCQIFFFKIYTVFPITHKTTLQNTFEMFKLLSNFTLMLHTKSFVRCQTTTLTILLKLLKNSTPNNKNKNQGNFTLVRPTFRVTSWLADDNCSYPKVAEIPHIKNFLSTPVKLPYEIKGGGSLRKVISFCGKSPS